LVACLTFTSLDRSERRSATFKPRDHGAASGHGVGGPGSPGACFRGARWLDCGLPADDERLRPRRGDLLCNASRRTMNGVKLAAATRRPRLEASSDAADAIQTCGGMITDVRQFSNLGLLLRCDITAARLTALIGCLDGAGIALDSESRGAVARLQGVDCRIDAALHIRFYGEEPDLRIPTPAVPG
jgi:hypothetical protein